MTTSHDLANPEKREDQKSSSESGQLSLQEILENIKVSLRIGDNKSMVSIQVCENSPHFDAALDPIFKQYISGIEWRFVQDLYRASLLPEDQQQARALELVEQYITAPGPQDIALNIDAKFLEKIAKNVREGGGLDSFLPIFGTLPGDTGMMTLVQNNVSQNGQISPEHASLLRAAYDQDQKMSPQDKSMLSIRSVICNAIKGIEEQKILSTGTFLQKAKKAMTRSNRAIDASMREMTLIQERLNYLLQMSAQPGVDFELVQKEFQKIMNNSFPHLIKAHAGLVKELGVAHPHVQKINAFLNILSGAVHENGLLNGRDPVALASLVSPENSAQIQKRMAPIEKQMKEAEKRKAPVQASPTVSKRT